MVQQVDINLLAWGQFPFWRGRGGGGGVLWSMICDGHILNVCFAFKTWARLRKWQWCTLFTYNQTHWICLMSSGSSVECPPPVMFIDKLLFISGREAQDTGQMQPPFDRKTLCGSHHHWKGVFLCLLYQLLQSSSPIVGWQHLKYIKADGATEDLLSFISGSERGGCLCSQMSWLFCHRRARS